MPESNAIEELCDKVDEFLDRQDDCEEVFDLRIAILHVRKLLSQGD